MTVFMYFFQVENCLFAFHFPKLSVCKLCTDLNFYLICVQVSAVLNECLVKCKMETFPSPDGDVSCSILCINTCAGTGKGGEIALLL